MLPNTGPAAQAMHAALTALQQGDAETARTKAEEALEGFSLANDRTGAAAAHQLLAMLHVQVDNLAFALPHLDAAIPLREATGDWEGVASLWQERFELSLRLGDGAGAREAAEKQVAAIERTADKEGLAHALHQLGQVLLQTGDDKGAEELVQRALFEMAGPGTERARAALLLLYASVAMHRGEYDRAMTKAREALELARQAKNRGAEVDALSHLGAIHALKGDLSMAKRVLEEALVGRELLKDAEGRAGVLRELANVEFALGEDEDAFGRLDYAARSLAEAGNLVGAIAMLQLFATAAEDHERPDLAVKATKGMVAAAAKTGDKEAEAAAHFTLATRLAGVGDLAGAAAHFRTAQDAQLALGLAHEAAVSAGMLGQVLVADGRRDEGLALVRGSLQQLDALGSEAADTVREILGELEREG